MQRGEGVLASLIMCAGRKPGAAAGMKWQVWLCSVLWRASKEALLVTGRPPVSRSVFAADNCLLRAVVGGAIAAKVKLPEEWEGLSIAELRDSMRKHVEQRVRVFEEFVAATMTDGVSGELETLKEVRDDLAKAHGRGESYVTEAACGVFAEKLRVPVAVISAVQSSSGSAPQARIYAPPGKTAVSLGVGQGLVVVCDGGHFWVAVPRQRLRLMGNFTVLGCSVWRSWMLGLHTVPTVVSHKNQGGKSRNQYGGRGLGQWIIRGELHEDSGMRHEECEAYDPSLNTVHVSQMQIGGREDGRDKAMGACELEGVMCREQHAPCSWQGGNGNIRVGRRRFELR